MATMHLQMTIPFARAQIKRDLQDGRYPLWLQTGDGDTASVEDMLAFLDALEADGYEYVPCSCTVDAKGRCTGSAV